MRKIALSITLLIAFSANTFASCIDVADSQIQAKEDRLITLKRKQKRVAVKTGATVGVVNAAFWGVMFGLIADGATIPASILVGAGYGVISGGAAIAVVAVPMIVYNQVIKAKIRGIKKTKELLIASENLDSDHRLVRRMHRKVRRKIPNITKEELMDEINIASASRDLCPEGASVFRFSKVKRFLKRQDYQEENDVIFKLESSEESLNVLN